VPELLSPALAPGQQLIRHAVSVVANRHSSRAAFAAPGSPSPNVLLESPSDCTMKAAHPYPSTQLQVKEQQTGPKSSAARHSRKMRSSPAPAIIARNPRPPRTRSILKQQDRESGVPINSRLIRHASTPSNIATGSRNHRHNRAACIPQRKQRSRTHISAYTSCVNLVIDQSKKPEVLPYTGKTQVISPKPLSTEHF